MVFEPNSKFHSPQKRVCTKTPLPSSLSRYHTLGKRATPEEETAEFLNDWVDFKVQQISLRVFDQVDFYLQGDLEHKIGNLTCVFDKMGLHTASGDVRGHP